MRVFYLLVFLLGLFGSASPQNDEIAGYVHELEKEGEKEARISLLKKIIPYYTHNNPDSAEFYCNLLIAESEDPVSFSFGYAMKGLTQVFRGDFESSLKTQLQGLKYARESKDEMRLGIAYNNIGISYDYMGDYPKALKYYKKGLEYRRKINDLEGIEGSLCNIGLVCYLKGDLLDALKYLFAAMNMSEILEHESGIASAATNIHLVYNQLGDKVKSIDYLRIAQKIYEKQNDKIDLALGYNNFGAYFQEIHQFDSALYFHDKALAIREEIQDRSGVAMSLRNLGSVFFVLDSFSKSEKLLMRSMYIADSIPDPVTQIEARKALIDLYLKQKRFSAIRPVLEKAIELINEGGGYINAFTIYKQAADYYSASGDHKNALKYFREYIASKDSLQSAENEKMLMKKELEYIYEKESREKEFKNHQEKLAREATLARQNLFMWLLGAGFFCLLVLAGFIFRSYTIKKKANTLLSTRNSVITQQNKEITKQKTIIELKNKDITDSIRYAKRLQNAILPAETKFSDAFTDFFLLYKPKDIVSGDIYWFHDLSSPSEKDFLFAVIDCTGHGVPGGFVSIVAHNALNRAVREFGLRNPDEILNKVNELVEDHFKTENGDEIRDGMDIALCRLKKSNGTASCWYAGANNPLWVINKNKELKEIKADAQPIGRFIDRQPFTLHELQLTRGDKVYMFSDGYADQFGGPKGKKFKYSQLKEILISSHENKMSSQKTILHTKIEEWQRGYEQIDDICVLGWTI